MFNKSLVLLIVLSISSIVQGQTIRVTTYNIKFLNDSISAQRKSNLKTVISDLQTDVIGLQEIGDRDALENIFDQNDWILLIDDDSDESQDLAAALRKSKVELVDFGTDLDADNDDFLFPRSQDNSPFPKRRDVLKVKVKEKVTGKTFILLVHHAKARVGGRKKTTHRREEAANRLVDVIDTNFDGEDLILLGDFNDTPNDSSLNILESGDSTKTAQMENRQGTFLVNLTEPLWANGAITHRFSSNDVMSGKLVAVDNGAPVRDFNLRNSNDRPNNREMRNLLDNILVPPYMLSKIIPGSVKVFDGMVAVNGSNRSDWPSDHLPVSVDVNFDGNMSPLPTTMVKIFNMLPNPTGRDTGNEYVTLRNEGTAVVPLSGWKLIDRSGHSLSLNGTIDGGTSQQIDIPVGKLPLTNGGDEIRLIDNIGREVDKRSYIGSQATSGNVISFP